MKEGFRKVENEVLPGKDILFIARKDAVNVKSTEVEKSIRRALEKCGLIKQNNK